MAGVHFEGSKLLGPQRNSTNSKTQDIVIKGIESFKMEWAHSQPQTHTWAYIQLKPQKTTQTHNQSHTDTNNRHTHGHIYS